MDDQLERLPRVYAEFLLLQRDGLADTAIAERLGIPIESLPLLARLAEAKTGPRRGGIWVTAVPHRLPIPAPPVDRDAMAVSVMRRSSESAAAAFDASASWTGVQEPDRCPRLPLSGS
jgi:hypothetical protein